MDNDVIDEFDHDRLLSMKRNSVDSFKMVHLSAITDATAADQLFFHDAPKQVKREVVYVKEVNTELLTVRYFKAVLLDKLMQTAERDARPKNVKVLKKLEMLNIGDESKLKGKRVFIVEKKSSRGAPRNISEHKSQPVIQASPLEALFAKCVEREKNENQSTSAEIAAPSVFGIRTFLDSQLSEKRSEQYREPYAARQRKYVHYKDLIDKKTRANKDGIMKRIQSRTSSEEADAERLEKMHHEYMAEHSRYGGDSRQKKRGKNNRRPLKAVKYWSSSDESAAEESRTHMHDSLSEFDKVLCMLKQALCDRMNRFANSADDYDIALNFLQIEPNDLVPILKKAVINEIFRLGHKNSAFVHDASYLLKYHILEEKFTSAPWMHLKFPKMRDFDFTKKRLITPLAEAVCQFVKAPSRKPLTAPATRITPEVVNFLLNHPVSSKQDLPIRIVKNIKQRRRGETRFKKSAKQSGRVIPKIRINFRKTKRAYNRDHYTDILEYRNQTGDIPRVLSWLYDKDILRQASRIPPRKHMLTKRLFKFAFRPELMDVEQATPVQRCVQLSNMGELKRTHPRTFLKLILKHKFNITVNKIVIPVRCLNNMTSLKMKKRKSKRARKTRPKSRVRAKVLKKAEESSALKRQRSRISQRNDGADGKKSTRPIRKFKAKSNLKARRHLRSARRSKNASRSNMIKLNKERLAAEAKRKRKSGRSKKKALARKSSIEISPDHRDELRAFKRNERRTAAARLRKQILSCKVPPHVTIFGPNGGWPTPFLRNRIIFENGTTRLCKISHYSKARSLHEMLRPWHRLCKQIKEEEKNRVLSARREAALQHQKYLSRQRRVTHSEESSLRHIQHLSAIGYLPNKDFETSARPQKQNDRPVDHELLALRTILARAVRKKIKKVSIWPRYYVAPVSLTARAREFFENFARPYFKSKGARKLTNPAGLGVLCGLPSDYVDEDTEEPEIDLSQGERLAFHELLQHIYTMFHWRQSCDQIRLFNGLPREEGIRYLVPMHMMPALYIDRQFFFTIQHITFLDTIRTFLERYIIAKILVCHPQPHIKQLRRPIVRLRRVQYRQEEDLIQDETSLPFLDNRCDLPIGMLFVCCGSTMQDICYVYPHEEQFSLPPVLRPPNHYLMIEGYPQRMYYVRKYCAEKKTPFGYTYPTLVQNLCCSSGVTDVPFELKIDNLLFVGFPKKLTDNPNGEKRPEHDLEYFHIVFVLPEGISQYYNLSRRLAYALDSLQQTNNYITQQYGKMYYNHVLNWLSPRVNHEEDRESPWAAVRSRVPLAQMFAHLIEDVKKTGIAQVFMDNFIELGFCLETRALSYAHLTPRTWEEIDRIVARIRPYHSILLLEDVTPSPDSNPTVSMMLKHCDPDRSILDISDASGIPLMQVLFVVRHLLLYARAVVIYPIVCTNIYSSATVTKDLERLRQLVLTWFREHRRFQEFFGHISTLAETLTKFNPPLVLHKYVHHTLPLAVQQVRTRIVVYLLRHQLLMQLHTYAYLVPPESYYNEKKYECPDSINEIIDSVPTVIYPYGQKGVKRTQIPQKTISPREAKSDEERKYWCRPAHLPAPTCGIPAEVKEELRNICGVMLNSGVPLDEVETRIQEFCFVAPLLDGAHHIEDLMYRFAVSREKINEIFEHFSPIISTFLRPDFFSCDEV